MALSFAHGAIRWLAADAVNTTHAVSGLAFQPKALRFYWIGLDSAGVDVASEAVNSRRGVGFATGTSSRRSVSSFSQDTAATSNCGSGACDDAVACTTDGAGATDGKLDLSAIASDGFTLIVDDQGVADITVFWEAWGGDDILVAAVGDIAEPAATGNQDYTVTGFVAGATDQVVMFAGVQSTAAVNTAQAGDSGMHVGFAASATAADNVTVCGNSDDASTAMDTDGYCQSDECLSMVVVAGGTTCARAVLTQFGTDNFRLNWLTRQTTNRRSVFLAIKGGSWKSGSFTIAGNTLNNTAAVSGLAWKPIGLSLIGRMTAESTAGAPGANDRIGLGTGTTTSSRRSMGMLDEDATVSSACEIDTTIQYDQVLCYPSTAGALLTAYDISSMDAGGFTLINDLAGGVASEWIGYLTFASGTAISASCSGVCSTSAALTTAITMAASATGICSAFGSLTGMHLYVDTDVGNDANDGFAPGSGRAKATLGGALAIVPATLTTPYTVHCKGSVADTTADTSGIASTPTNYLEIVVDPADRHAGVYSASKYRLETTGDVTTFAATNDAIRITGVQVKATHSGTHNADQAISVGRATGGATDIRVSKNLVVGVMSGTPTNITGIKVGNTTDKCAILDNIVYGFVNGTEDTIIGIEVNDANVGTGIAVYGNTVTRCRTAIKQTSGNATIKNNYADGSLAGFAGTWAGSATNASSDASSPQVGLRSIAYSTAQFVNVTPTTEDLHLAGTGSALYQVGTDTSGEAEPLNCLTDIDGETRTTPRDIGADAIPQTAILLAASATGACSTAAALSTQITMASASSGVCSVAAALTTAITVAAASSGVCSASAAMTTAIRLLATSSGVCSAASSLSTQILMAASASGTCATSAALSTAITLAASSTGACSGSGILTTQITCAVAASGVCSTSGLLATDLMGASVCACSTSAALVTAITLAAGSTGTCSASCGLTTAIQCLASATGTCATSAAFSTAIVMASSSSAVCSVSATLSTAIRMATVASGICAAASSLTTAITLASTSSGVCAVSASLSTIVSFAASPSGVCSVAASLSTAITMAASATGICSAFAAFEAPMASLCSGTCSTSAALSTSITLAASCSSACAASSSLTTAIAGAASPIGTCACVAALTTTTTMAASCAGSCAVSAGLATGITFSSALSGSCTASGELATVIELAAAASVVCRTDAFLSSVGTPVEGSAQGICSVSATLRVPFSPQVVVMGHARAYTRLATARLSTVEATERHYLVTAGGPDG